MSTTVALVSSVWSSNQRRDVFALLILDYEQTWKLLRQMQLFDEMRRREPELRGLLLQHAPVYGSIEDDWDEILCADEFGEGEGQRPHGHRAFYAAMQEVERGAEWMLLADAGLPDFTPEEAEDEIAEVDGGEVFWRGKWPPHETPFSTPPISRVMLSEVAFGLAPSNRERADIFRQLMTRFPQAAALLLKDKSYLLEGELKAGDVEQLLSSKDDEVRLIAMTALGRITITSP